jgi:hypothetical protein
MGRALLPLAKSSRSQRKTNEKKTCSPAAAEEKNLAPKALPQRNDDNRIPLNVFENATIQRNVEITSAKLLKSSRHKSSTVNSSKKQGGVCF